MSHIWNDIPSLKNFQNEVDILKRYPSVKSVVNSSFHLPISILHFSSLEGSDRMLSCTLRERRYSFIIEMIKMNLITLKKILFHRGFYFVMCSKKNDGSENIYEIGVRGIGNYYFKHPLLYIDLADLSSNNTCYLPKYSQSSENLSL